MCVYVNTITTNCIDTGLILINVHTYALTITHMCTYIHTNVDVYACVCVCVCVHIFVSV